MSDSQRPPKSSAKSKSPGRRAIVRAVDAYHAAVRRLAEADAAGATDRARERAAGRQVAAEDALVDAIVHLVPGEDPAGVRLGGVTYIAVPDDPNEPDRPVRLCVVAAGRIADLDADEA